MKLLAGFVRRLDNVGRVVLPMDLRRRLGLTPGDRMEIFASREGTVVMRRYEPDELSEADRQVMRSTRPRRPERG